MGWFTTEAVAEFLAEAGQFLRAEPARNTVILSVTEDLRLKAAAPPDSREAPGRGGPDAGPGHSRLPASEEPLFGWWQSGPRGAASPSQPGPDAVRAAFMHTPGFPVFLTAMSGQVAAELAGLLAEAGRAALGVNASAQAARRSRISGGRAPGPRSPCTAACACTGSARSSRRILDLRAGRGWPASGTETC